MSSGRWIVLLALGLTGCRALFGLDDLTPDAGLVYDRCAPAAFDPLRYQTISVGAFSGLGRSWSDARRACQLVGMDLVVFNDEHEFGQAPVEGWPYWFGASQDETGVWHSVDDCPVIAEIEPDAPQPPECGVVMTALDPVAINCNGDMPMPMDPDVGPPAALCETPRPLDAKCVQEHLAAKHYEISAMAMTFDAARGFCEAKREHLVVIDSFDELGVLSRLVSDQSLGSFWIGATFDGTRWSSVTGCPPEFSWSDPLPQLLDSAPDCVASVIMQDLDHTTSTTQPSMHGMQIVRCDDTRFALCESD